MANSLYQQLNGKNMQGPVRPSAPQQMPQMNRGQMLMQILTDPKGFYEKALSSGLLSQDWVNQNMSRAKQLQSQLMQMRK